MTQSIRDVVAKVLGPDVYFHVHRAISWGEKKQSMSFVYPELDRAFAVCDEQVVDMDEQSLSRLVRQEAIGCLRHTQERCGRIIARLETEGGES